MARHTAFEILYADYYRRVFGLCRRLLGRSASAEDATQEVFMRAYRSFGKYNTAQPFWQWIATIASNHCIDLLRQSQRSAQLFGDETEESELADTEQASTLSLLIQHENASALNEAISQLPDKFRVPLVLAYFSQRSYKEIAEQLGISRNHVGVLLLRARAQLRADMQEQASGGAV